MRTLIISVLSATSLLASAQSSQNAVDSQAIFDRTKAATVIVLTGEGAGRLHSIATGVVISNDGVILTAWHAIKGALEVQVRTEGGDVFDHVKLLGYDERRDVAALKITASALPAITPGTTASLSKGDTVYAVTNGGGLKWSTTQGVISAIRPADEVPGVGTGFRIMQFTAPVASDAIGGALVDRSGALIGIIVSVKNLSAFAIPIENVLGLPDLGTNQILGSGANLEMPAKRAAAVPKPSSPSSTKPKPPAHETSTVDISANSASSIEDAVNRAQAAQ
jgi:S1-C subfamily serine protease